MNNTEMLIEMIDKMPGGFFIYHADGNEEIIHINRSMLRIFGCDTLEEFKEHTGYTFPGIIYPDDLNRVEESIREQIKHSEYDLDYVEYRIVKKDGTVRWVEDYGHFIHTKQYGDVFYVFIEDATDRMKSRMEQLQEMNDKLHKAYSKERQYRKAILHDATFFFEVNLSKDSFISSAVQILNGENVDMFEYLRIEPIEKYSDYVSYWQKNGSLSDPEEYGRFFEINRLIRCYEKGDLEQNFDAWVTDSTGKKRLYQYILLMGKDRETQEVIGLFMARDVTNLAEGKKLLKLALEQAKAANIARSTFLSNMSHDIRTPLNGIMGYIDLIRKHQDDRKKLNDYLDKIQFSSESLLTIINESLEYTCMESGRAVLVETEGDISDLLEELEKQTLPAAKAKGLEFEMDKSEIRHSRITADFLRMKEVLWQLLDNAVKYTPRGGKVKLSVTEQKNVSKGYVKYQFAVEDTGIGLSPGDCEKIFEPFERVQNTTESGIIGSGLGLAVTKNLLDMMEGTIKVESTKGKGSIFTVTVVFKRTDLSADAASAAVRTLKPSELIGKRILVAEDNEINMEIATELLKEQGFLVDQAQNGRVAVDKVSSSKPGYYDLVLMDIQMPVMDGYEATRQIRSLTNHGLAEIPIIAFSANAFAEDQEKSLESGMNAHFPKPVNIHDLKELMGKILA